MLFHMLDLIDTYEANVNNDPNGDESIASVSTSTASLIDGFFTGGLGTDVYNNVPENNDDPFADVSVHGQNNKEELNDIFGSNSQVPLAEGNSKGDVNHLMVGLSINGNKSLAKQTRASHVELTGTILSDSTTNPCHQPNDVLDNKHKCQSTAYNNALSSGLMFNSMAFTSQPKNYGAMSSVLAQQQFLSAMANLRQIGNLQSQNVGASNISGTQPGLYDFFNSSIAAPTASTVTNKSKKEDTGAFDFISTRIRGEEENT